jgi:hypothetical protein
MKHGRCMLESYTRPSARTRTHAHTHTDNIVIIIAFPLQQFYVLNLVVHIVTTVCSQIHTKHLVVHRITTVCSQIHIKHINALCGQNVEFLCVKSGGTYSYRSTFTATWRMTVLFDFSFIDQWPALSTCPLCLPLARLAFAWTLL